MPDLRWFPSWLTEHLARHRSLGLPALDSEEGRLTFEAWQEAIGDRRITVDGAMAASKRLVAEPPRFKSDHFKTFLDFAVEATRRLAEREGRQVQHDLSTREGAELASKECQRCTGSGLATVRYAGNHNEARDKKIPLTCAAYCVCAYGRWIMKNHAERAKDLCQRIPDLADAIAGRGCWYPHRASDPDGEEMTATPAEMIRAIVSRGRVPQKPIAAQHGPEIVQCGKAVG